MKPAGGPHLKFLYDLCCAICSVLYNYVPLGRRLAGWGQETWLEHGIGMGGSREPPVPQKGVQDPWCYWQLG